jgi:hypothetical protein
VLRFNRSRKMRKWFSTASTKRNENEKKAHNLNEQLRNNSDLYVSCNLEVECLVEEKSLDLLSASE